MAPQVTRRFRQLKINSHCTMVDYFTLKKNQVAQSNPNAELTPAMEKVANDLAYGKLAFSQFRTLTGYSRNMGQKLAIYQKAAELNPNFEPAQFEAGYKLYANPQIRQRLVAIDALGPVIDKIEGLAQKADLTNLPAVNKALSAAKFQLGNTTITNYRQLQTLLGDEVGNALGVGTGSDLKTKLGLDLVNPNLGPKQFMETMGQLRDVLNARKAAILPMFGPYGQQQSGAPPQPSNGSGGSKLPQSTLANGQIQVTAPDGSTHLFATAAAAQKFQAAVAAAGGR